MHILWINDNSSFAGGAERYIADVVPEIRRRNSRCTLLYDPLLPTDSQFVTRFDEAYPLAAPLHQFSDIDPDVVFVHNLAQPDILPRLRSIDAPVIRYFHDHRLFCLREKKYTTLRHRTCTRKVGVGCYPCLGFLNKSNRWPGISMRTVGSLHREQRTNQALDAFVVGSAYMRDHVVAHGFDPQRIWAIPPVLKSPDVQPSGERDPNLLLFVGSLVRGKGLDVLLEALVQVPRPTRLVVAGTGRQADWFRDLTQRYGLHDRVDYVGSLGGKDLDAAYRHAACVVIPSRGPETFSRVGPEALFRGTPVIATGIGGVSEWLRHEETGLAVPSNDPRSLADAIRYLIDNPGVARKLAARGQELCRAAYSSKRHVDELMALFESLAAFRSAL